MNLTINGRSQNVPAGWEDESLLWVLREAIGLVGTKFGCGVGLCGACTVLVDGAAQRACLLPLHAVQGREVTTIEGLARGDTLHPVQQAWLDEAVPQCGYCQSGQIVGAVALLRSVPQPSDAQIDDAMAGHLCRCGTQHRVRAAIHRVAGQPAGPKR
ncbi:(2Fe-2S)-binding protein [Piscinibacter sp.]|uniref:(2Fe-2S)-binding protein n=1 Tax=Piscinibacter sp. TaxID=1903157 RepID=UPI002B533895|nr:(2Fe-2S)-binding protein [Albitalea sp.]HUG24556.1 (2Fe-2S)-binding protein [Albitalea sp.]